ncbi:MAG TPA: succinate dehydrogenase, cytochrome b556 subunit [Streptosporangiaceae bacterium]
MTAAQVAFLAAFSLLLVLLVAATVGIVAAAARPAGPTGRRGLLRALGLSPSLPAAPTRWAHYLHRLTGIGIAAFLALHIADVSLLAFSASLYNRVHQLYGTPVLRLFECALLLAVLFHTLNGLRLILTDVAGLSLPATRRALWATVALTLLAGLPASALILAPVL